MTIKEYIQKQGWSHEKEPILCQSMTVDIDFLNQHDQLDETEFTIEPYNVDELTKLYHQFCKEEQIAHDTIQGVTIIEYHDCKPECVDD